MTKKPMKTGMMILASVLLVALACAGAAGATGSIVVSTATASTVLSDTTPLGTIVYGDYGQAANGTITLRQIGDDDTPWILEMENFKASSSTAPIINSTADLKIVLKGNSDLVGSVGGNDGLVYSSGDLTINATAGTYGKVVVENTVSTSFTRAIQANNDLAIESGADVTAIARNIGYGRTDSIVAKSGNVTIDSSAKVTVRSETNMYGNAYGIYAAETGDITIAGAGTVVDVEATNSFGTTYAIVSGSGNIVITSDAQVTSSATATNADGCAHALLAYNGGITISGNASVTATAVATNTDSFAYAVRSDGYDGDILIGSGANVVATATVTGDRSSCYAVTTRYIEGDIIIDSGATVTAAATATGADSCVCTLYSTYGAITVDSGADATVTAMAADAAYTFCAISIGYSEKPFTVSDHADLTVTATATDADDAVYAVYLDGDIVIGSGANVTAAAYGVGDTSALSSWSSLRIDGAGTVDATADSSAGYAYSLSAHELMIDSSSTVAAHAETDGKDCSAYGLYCGDDLSIAGSSVASATARSANGSAYSVYANNGILISSAKVHATASSTPSPEEEYGYLPYAMALYGKDSIRITGSSEVTAVADAANIAEAYAMYAYAGDILVDGDCDICATADGDSVGFAVFVEDSYCEDAAIIIADCKKFVAEGALSSFAHRPLAGFDISQLEDTHWFRTGGVLLTYDQVIGDWQFDEDAALRFSDYPKVTIEEGIAPPVYSITLAPVTGGTVLASPSASIIAGSEVRLIAIPDSGYAFVSWNSSDPQFTSSTENPYTFTMPATSLAITSEIVLIEKTVEPDPETRVAPVDAGLVQNEEGAEVTLVCVGNVENAIVFAAKSKDTDTLPTASPGYHGLKVYATCQIDRTGGDTGMSDIVLDISLEDPKEKSGIYLKHYSTATSSWDSGHIAPSKIEATDDQQTFRYTFRTDTFSPFAVVYEAAPSGGSSHQGGSRILAATDAPTVTPTQTPTTAETPLVPTVKPSTQQPTQQSPAPFVGLVLGLGAAAVLLRLRR